MFILSASSQCITHNGTSQHSILHSTYVIQNALKSPAKLSASVKWHEHMVT